MKTYTFSQMNIIEHHALESASWLFSFNHLIFNSRTVLRVYM